MNDRLAAARAALDRPASNPVALKYATDLMARVATIDIVRHRLCGLGRLVAVEMLAPWRSRPPPAKAVTCREATVNGGMILSSHLSTKIARRG